MTRRSWSIRGKLTALLLLPLVSLAALWGYAADLTLGNALTLKHDANIGRHLADPLGRAIVALQAERRNSLIDVESPKGRSTAQLRSSRSATDGPAKNFLTQARNGGVRGDESAAVRTGVDRAVKALAAVPGIREQVDRRTIDGAKVLAVYTAVDNSVSEALRTMTVLPNQRAQNFARALYTLVPAGDILSQEDALISGAAASGERLTPGGYAAAATDIGAQRVLTQQAIAELPAAQREPFLELGTPGGALGRVTVLENQLIAAGPNAPHLPFSLAKWRAAYDPEQRMASSTALKDLTVVLSITGPPVHHAIVALVLAGLLGLIALVVSILMSVRITRSLIGDVARLRGSARNLTDDRLRDVVGRLRRGESVDIRADMTQPVFVNREMAELGAAFDALQLTAVDLAHEDIRLHQGFSAVFTNLARRSQSLIHRQLSMLDSMERHEEDPRTLEQLFRLDQLATRMRRYAEGLIIVSGAPPGRFWRHPIPVVDVVRGAIAETEDYSRVVVLPVPEVGIAGRAAADVIHLLAELIENAEVFSPSDSEVRVSVGTAAGGLIIEIDDRGLGMLPEELADANAQMTSSLDVSSLDGTRLGLVTAGRLAQRHDIGVSLRRSPYGGVNAVTLIPPALLEWGKIASPGPTQSGMPVNRGQWANGRRLAGQGRRLGEREVQADPAHPVPQTLAAGLRPAPDWTPEVSQARQYPHSPAPSEPGPPPNFDSPDTVDGLPRRVPQASLARELRNEGEAIAAGRLMDWGGSGPGMRVPDHSLPGWETGPPSSGARPDAPSFETDAKGAGYDSPAEPGLHEQLDAYERPQPHVGEPDAAIGWQTAPQSAGDSPSADGPGRPEQVRSIMSALQAGAARARRTQLDTTSNPDAGPIGAGSLDPGRDQGGAFA